MIAGKATIGTRGSMLAMWQSKWVRDLLVGKWPDLEVGIDVIRTTG
ncbi:MAG: hydroxymethylbilane synthase, partial [Deltaproteobacteria bacterium]|nr:hydroxymethylbilane synthase [Deltaproteobacteria bacterium]